MLWKWLMRSYNEDTYFASHSAVKTRTGLGLDWRWTVVGLGYHSFPVWLEALDAIDGCRLTLGLANMKQHSKPSLIGFLNSLP